MQKIEITKTGVMPTKKDLTKYLQKGVLPIRFCYPKKGGDKWHELRKNEAYNLGERELTAFKEGLKSVKSLIGKNELNLIHLGPGDGIELPILFRIFRPKNKEKYAGVDISKKMILNTAQLNKDTLCNINALWYLTDIETKGNLKMVCKDIKNKGTKINLLILANQGVLSSNPETFHNIRESMNSQDYLFITIEGDALKEREEILSTYDLQAVRDLLGCGLKQAGYNYKKGKFKTTFNEKKSRTEVYFYPTTNTKILCLTSYKPKEQEFRQRLASYGFDIKFLKFYKKVHTFAVLCKRRK